MVKAVLFDLDGTLCDTLGDLAASLNYALRTFDDPTFSDAEVQRMVGNGIHKLCERAVPDDRQLHVPSVYALLLAHYQKHCLDRTKPYPGMVETLAALRLHGIKLGVLTNKAHPSAIKILEALFPAGTFDYLLGQTERYPLKPDPAMLFAALDALHAAPSEAVYVGDSDVDVRFAEAAGLNCIGCAWGFRGRQHLIDAGAMYVIDRPEQLLDMVYSKEVSDGTE